MNQAAKIGDLARSGRARRVLLRHVSVRKSVCTLVRQLRGRSSSNIAATCRFVVPWMRVSAHRSPSVPSTVALPRCLADLTANVDQQLLESALMNLLNNGF